MDYSTYTDAELRRLIAASPETNEAAHLEAVRRFVEQDEMYTQAEMDEAEEEARNIGYDNCSESAYQDGYGDGRADGEAEGYDKGYAAALKESEEE